MKKYEQRLTGSCWLKSVHKVDAESRSIAQPEALHGKDRSTEFSCSVEFNLNLSGKS
jgi:hypothetical protein